MPRARTGSVEYVPGKNGEQGHYRGRIVCPDGSRPVIHFDPSPQSPQAEARAKERAAHYSEEAAVRGIVAAKRLSPAARAQVASGVEDEGSSMAKWLETWLASRVAKGQTSTRENDSHYRKHIEPVMGEKHVRDWTQDDLRALSSSLDAKVASGALKWKSATNIWGSATKLCGDAMKSKIDALRCRKDSPAVGVEGPDRGARTAKQYLYPSEFLRFVECEGVPLQWRRIVTLLTYVYCRPGELRELRWEDVDLEHGTMHLHQATNRVTGKAKSTKTAAARRIPIEPTLLPLLGKMHEECGGRGRVVELPSDRDMARSFRLWLTRAKVDRAELHTTTPTRKAATCYDLRATGITWLAIRGDEPLRIMQRAGHTSFATTQGYIREAENLREGFGAVFPPLPLKALGVDVKVPEPPDEEPGSTTGSSASEGLGPVSSGSSASPLGLNAGESPAIDTVGREFESRPLRSKYPSRSSRETPYGATDGATGGDSTEAGGLDLPQVLALAKAVAAFVTVGDHAHARPLANELVTVLEAAEGRGAAVVPIGAGRSRK